VRLRATGWSKLTRLPALYRERNATIDASAHTQSREFAIIGWTESYRTMRRTEFDEVPGSKRVKTGLTMVHFRETVIIPSNLKPRSDAPSRPMTKPNLGQPIRQRPGRQMKQRLALRVSAPDGVPEEGNRGPDPEIAPQFNISLSDILLIVVRRTDAASMNRCWNEPVPPSS
jgi:hypothetical protein